MFKRETLGTIDVVVGESALISEHLGLLSSLLEECLESGQPRAVLDMRGAPLIDSAGLELLLDAQDEFRRRGGVLKLAAVSPLCSEVLSISGVEDRFEIHADVNAAVGSFVQ